MKHFDPVRPISKWKVGLFVIGVLVLLVFGSEVFATTPKPPAPDPAPTSTASADSAALAAARAASAADANARAVAAQQQRAVSGASSEAEGGDATATGGEGIGTVEGDSTRVRTLGLALNVAGATAAPAWGSDCHVHSRGRALGWGAYSRSGGTKIDAQCAARLHCLRIADRMAAWGVVEGALRQLAQCDGVTAEAPPAPAAAPPAAVVPPVDGVSRRELDDAVRRLEERQDVMFRRGIGK